MFTIQTEHSFDAAHFLSKYDGKCKNIHGHCFRVLVTVHKECLGSDGMVVDFSILKKDLKQEVDYFDHALIIEKGTLRPNTYHALEEEEFKIIEVDFRPTAEYFAKYFYERMLHRSYCVESVRVYETEKNSAEYREG